MTVEVVNVPDRPPYTHTRELIDGQPIEVHHLRRFTVAQLRAQGYALAYCPLCSCRKSGDVDEPNGVDEGCARETCRCHEDDA